MATFLSGAAWGTWSGQTKYVTLTGDVTRSGNTVTLSNMKLYFTATGASASGYNMTIYVRDGWGGSNVLSTTGVRFAFSGGTSNTVSLNNASVTVGTGDTSHSFNIKSNDDSAVANFTVSFSAGYTKPNTPTISATAKDSRSISITWGTSSFGNPSSGTVYLYGGTSSTPATQLTTKTSTGNTTYTYSNLNPNTTYYFRARAYNNQLYSDYSSTVSAKTKPGNYVPVSGKSRAVKKYYAPISGKSRTVLKLYDSKNGKSRRIY